MNIHNVMESIVIDKVNEIFKEKEGFDLADCLQCRLDVACYVLNRIKPEYIISGRGLLHFNDNYHDLMQTQIDLVSLINEGIQKVQNIKRPYYGKTDQHRNVSTNYLYNFPAILGTVLIGETFMPVNNLSISLLENNSPTQMIDNTWQNPFFIEQNIKGNYSFMPEPVPADEFNEKKVFQFELRIDDIKYEPVSHFFELELLSMKDIITTFSMSRTHKIAEIYLFPKES